LVSPLTVIIAGSFRFGSTPTLPPAGGPPPSPDGATLSPKVDSSIAVRRTGRRPGRAYAAGVGRIARLGRWPRRRSVLLDAALALLVAVVSAVIAVEESQRVSDTVALVRLGTGLLAAVGTLLLRRHPLPLLAVTVLDSVPRGDLSVAAPFAAYAVARHQPVSGQRWAALVPAAALMLAPWQFTSADAGLNNVLLVGFLFVLPAVLGAGVRTRAELVAALVDRAERAESEQQLRAREAVLAERARITMEMHDVVGHRVSLMVLQAGAIDMAADDPAKVRQLAGQLQDAGRRSLEELRQLIGLVQEEDAPLAPQPTLVDVAGLVEDARRAGVEVTLTRRGADREVDPIAGRTAYRVVQEALTNAGKHAPGGAVAVTLDVREQELAVTVVNRRGTRPAAPLPSGGLGLLGLRERVRTVGGTFRAEPRLDGGFAVEAVMPG
jgi:signal transduction histidine kinase